MRIRLKALRAEPGRRRAPGIWTIALFALGAVLIARGTPLWWFGSACLVAGATLGIRVWAPELTVLRDRLGRPRTLGRWTVVPATALLDVLYVGLIAYIATVMMSDIVAGGRPVSHDHTVHYFKAWQLHEFFLSQGRIHGWSHRWFTGYPVNYLYPIGADLWVNAVHLFNFGGSFARSYGIAFWLFHVFTGYAGYRFGRIVGGPHVGALTGLLMITDMSEFRLGGWAYTIQYGVWPQALSLSFALLAICRLPRLAEGRDLAAIGSFGFWMGLAVLTHPVQLILLVMLALVAAVSAAFAGRHNAGTLIGNMVSAYLVALLVSAVWLLPFLTLRAQTNVMGIWWDSSYEMGRGLLKLAILPGTLAYVLSFGMIAVALMIKTRRFILLCTALMALFIPAVTNSTFIDEFHLPSVSASFTKIQFIRLSTMVKPFWFALSGYAIVSLLTALSRIAPAADSAHRPSRESHVRACVLAALVTLLTLPIVVPAAQAFWAENVAKSLVTDSTRELLKDRERLTKWLHENLPNDGWYRIGVFTGHNHDLMDLGVELNRPIYKRGFTPASNFIYKMRTREPGILRAVNPRFAIAKRFLPREDFELIETFGRYRVYKYRHWKPEPFTIQEGEGDVKLERFADEEIVLVAAPGSKGTLRLNVSHFPRWKVYLDGKRIPMSLTYVEDEPEQTGFMTVPLRTGRYRFVFEHTITDRLAFPITLVGLLLVCGLVWTERRPPGILALRRGVGALTGVFEAMARPGSRRLRVALLAVFGVVVLVVGIGLSEWRPAVVLDPSGEQPAPESPPVKSVRFDFLENLNLARARIDYPDVSQPCKRFGDRLICRDVLGNLDSFKYVASHPVTIEEYKMVRCIRARPETDAVLTIRYPEVPVADAIVGYYGIEREGRLMTKKRPVDFTIRAGNRVIYDDATKTDSTMHWFNVSMKDIKRDTTEISFSVRSPNTSKRYFCFHAQMVDL